MRTAFSAWSPRYSIMPSKMAMRETPTSAQATYMLRSHAGVMMPAVATMTAATQCMAAEMCATKGTEWLRGVSMNECPI